MSVRGFTEFFLKAVAISTAFYLHKAITEKPLYKRRRREKAKAAAQMAKQKGKPQQPFLSPCKYNYYSINLTCKIINLINFKLTQ